MWVPGRTQQPCWLYLADVDSMETGCCTKGRYLEQGVGEVRRRLVTSAPFLIAFLPSSCARFRFPSIAMGLRIPYPQAPRFCWGCCSVRIAVEIKVVAGVFNVRTSQKNYLTCFSNSSFCGFCPYVIPLRVFSVQTQQTSSIGESLVHVKSWVVV